MKVADLIKQLADWSPDTEVVVSVHAHNREGVEQYREDNALELVPDDETSDRCILLTRPGRWTTGYEVFYVRNDRTSKWSSRFGSEREARQFLGNVELSLPNVLFAHLYEVGDRGVYRRVGGFTRGE